MPITTPLPSRAPRRPVLFILLGVAGLAYVISLPWQRQQWNAIGKIKEENAIQEARIREIKTEQDTARAAETRLGEGVGDINTQLDAVRAYLSHGDTARAGGLLRQIETAFFEGKLPSKNASLASTLAGLFQEAGWIDRALVNAQRALEADPNGIESLLRLGVIEAQIGWQKDCRAHIEAARKVAPQAAEPHLALALLCDQVGASKEGEQELMTADRLRPNDEHITQLLFQNRMSQRLYEKALQTAEVGLKLRPTSTEFLAGRAEALIEQALSIPGKVDKERLQAGLEAAQRYKRIAPDNLDAHYLIGRVYQGLGDDVQALQEWESVYASRQKTPALAINLGRLLARRGDRTRGQQLIEAGEKQRAEGADYNSLLITAGMMRSNPEKQRELARWCQAHGRYSHAIFAWDQVLKLKPDAPEAIRERNQCLIRRT